VTDRSDEPAEGRWRPTRRSVLVGGGLIGAAAVLGVDLGVVASHKDTFRAFTPHQAAVVEAATARLVPGPSDDPAEAGHPGAREAGVVHYIDAVLGALHHQPPRIYAGGPFSNRGGAKHDDLHRFLDVSPAVREHWRARLADLQAAYSSGIAALDAASGGDFAEAMSAWQDQALTQNPLGFTDVLFQHTIEAMYGIPEYQGNRDLVGWHEIRFRGDTQPRGYTDAEVQRSDGPDRFEPAGVTAKVLTLLTATAPGAPSQVKIVGNR
jgi:hypothetical protein